jgi:hypothetical protein
VVLAGCSGAPPPRPLPAPTLAPWQIPQAAYGSQRLYRVTYSGPEGEGSFRVTLRLVSPARYQLQAVDPLGRALWSLDVLDDSGLALNHHNRTFCHLEGRFDLTGVPLGPFPLLSLPALLLGRVPAQPAANSPAAEPRGRSFDFRDDTDRRWAGSLGEQGIVKSWILTEGKSPKAWYMQSADGSILSERDRGVQVRWREAVRENLDKEPPRLEIPAGYHETECGDPALPDGSSAPPADDPDGR